MSAVVNASLSTAEAVRREGFVCVALDPNANDDALCASAWSLFTDLYEPIPQYRTGELMFTVQVAADAPGESHYSKSNLAGGWHTDGTLLPRRPDVAALLGLSPADEGGETVLIDGDDIVRQLEREAPGALSVLREPHPFDVKNQTDGVAIKRHALLTTDPSTGRADVFYLRMYIEDGYAKEGRPIPAEVREAFDALDRCAETVAIQERFLLQRGELLLWDNRRYLHGRLPFRENVRKRKLCRLYGVVR